MSAAMRELGERSSAAVFRKVGYSLKVLSGGDACGGNTRSHPEHDGEDPCGPNTTVKIRAADGTMLETAWESRRLPDILLYSMLLHVMSIQEGIPEC